MVTINEVTVCGFLGRDPDLRFTAQSRTPFVNLTVATNRSRKGSDGQYEPKSRSKRSRYSSENDVLIEKSVKYTDFFLLSIVYV